MSSKSELTKTIESQQAQITRLQQRFTDVVSAYKNLQKEKEALESTVRVLSTSAAAATVEELGSTDSNETAVVKESDESASETETTAVPSEQQTVQEKLRTLQQNVTIITEQKNRMEQMFQSDKRKLKTENEELKHSLEEAKAETIIIREKSDHEIKELKKLLRESQRDYERKTADHGVTVRELQTLLSAERNKLETIEHQFDESRAKVVTLESQMDTVKKQYATVNSQYQAKLNETREKDMIDLEELKRAKVTVSELTGKLKAMETEHVERLRSESKRNQQLEKKLVELTSENAQRLSSSETQMADLSEQIGVIEKQRAQDQVIIQRLKERIAQLDVENSLLTKATAASMDEDRNHLTREDQEENHPDFESLMKYISKLKVAIRQAHERFGKSLTIEEILNIEREMSTDGNTINGVGLLSEKNKVLQNKYQEEIERLKAELDRYRHKTVATFKAKAFKDTVATKETDELRTQIDQLREKLMQSQSLYNTEHDRHNQVVEKLQSCLTSIRDQHRHDIDQLLVKKRVEINELECELEKQRERTVRLLGEKDREIEAMRNQQGNSNSVFEPSPALDVPINEESSTIIGELFAHSSTIGGPSAPLNPESNNLLFFIQEQQLREQDVMSLRKQRHELELTIRDLQKKSSYEINQLQMHIEQLQDELERKQLSERRNESLTKNEHNIDYIKNVFYHYLLASDIQVKQTMANALMTILHFSSKEKAKIDSQKSNHSLSTSSWFSKT